MTVRGILGLGRVRRIVVRSLLVATALAIPAAMFVAPVTASADSDVSICESFGNGYCLGSDNTDLFTAVVERTFPGRKFDLDRQSGTFDGVPTYRIRFHADNSKCVAATNNFANVTIHPCDTGSGVVWARDHDSSTTHDRWINRLATQNKGSKQYLSGHNHLGSQYFLDCAACTSGDFQRFDVIP
jgi:hypothetical protein